MFEKVNFIASQHKTGKVLNGTSLHFAFSTLCCVLRKMLNGLRLKLCDVFYTCIFV